MEVIYAKIKNTWKEELTPIAVVHLVPEIIKYVQEESKASGPEKKEMAIKLITLLINDSSSENKEELLYLVDTTVPTMIDVMIQISKQDILLGKMKTKCMSCF